jgi:hypothetical protein
MGRRTGTESALALVVAFIKRKNWKQSDLARELGIGVPALRKKVTELQSAGMPLEKCDEPPNVYWRLPRSWLPEAVQLDATEVGELLRLLARLPNSATRNRLVDRVVQGRPRSSVQPGVVVAPAQDQQEEQWLSFVEDAARRERPRLMPCWSTHRQGSSPLATARARSSGSAWIACMARDLRVAATHAR